MRRRRGPIFERARIETHFEIFAEQREFFAQIEFVAEFDDDFVSFVDGRYWGRGCEPLRQAVFAHRQERGGKQLEEAAGAEDVEIIGINVFGIAEAFTGCAGA